MSTFIVSICLKEMTLLLYIYVSADLTLIKEHLNKTMERASCMAQGVFFLGRCRQNLL